MRLTLEIIVGQPIHEAFSDFTGVLEPGNIFESPFGSGQCGGANIFCIHANCHVIFRVLVIHINAEIAM